MPLPPPYWAILDIVTNLTVYKDVNSIVVWEPKLPYLENKTVLFLMKDQSDNDKDD